VARTADRKLTLVLDPDDDVDDLARLRRLHARPFGQIVCEPAPGGGSAGLTRSLLAALGKTLDREPCREPLWRLVDVHLRAERVRELIVLRAHTLTYPALLRLADHAHASGAQLSLVVHQERPPAPVAQLLEAFRIRPHPCRRCSSTRPISPSQTAARSCRSGRAWSSRTSARSTTSSIRCLAAACGSRSRAAFRVEIAPPSTTPGPRPTPGRPAGSDDHADWTYQEAADAVYALARRGDTASEIYVRIRAALDALHRAGVDTNLDASTASSSTASARPDPASSTPPSPAPRRWPTRPRTASSPR